MRMILLAAASHSHAMAGVASAQTSDEYPPCKTRAQDHCRVVGHMAGHHKMHQKMHHKTMAHHKAKTAEKPADKTETPKT
jgi:hypothetical protein